MNQNIIPTIIAATVVLAGLFAFAPVDNATAVHTTITNTQMSQVSSVGVLDLQTEVDCTSDAAFMVHWVAGEVIADDDVITVEIEPGDTTITFTFQTGALGEGYDGMTGSLVGEADDTFKLDADANTDAFISLITTADATASCED